jgi:hypothetical protein
MVRFLRLFLCVSCVIVIALPGTWRLVQARAQTSAKERPTALLPSAKISPPFDMNAPSAERANSIEFRAQDAMSPEERQAVGAAWPVITRNAANANFDLGEGKWQYEQIVCPALPEHLLLLFTRNNGVGDLSMFTAAVSRKDKGSIRILPILRRSYLPYTPAAVNPVTIAAFNQIRAHDRDSKRVDWLTTGLCYAAITGARVDLPLPSAEHKKDSLQLIMNPLLQVGADGGATIQFADIEAPQHPQQWELTFDPRGELLKVTIAQLKAPSIQMIH